MEAHVITVTEELLKCLALTPEQIAFTGFTVGVLISVLLDQGKIILQITDSQEYR